MDNQKKDSFLWDLVIVLGFIATVLTILSFTTGCLKDSRFDTIMAAVAKNTEMRQEANQDGQDNTQTNIQNDPSIYTPLAWGGATTMVLYAAGTAAHNIWYQRSRIKLHKNGCLKNE
jgi:hypothetical protein